FCAVSCRTFDMKLRKPTHPHKGCFSEIERTDLRFRPLLVRVKDPYTLALLILLPFTLPSRRAIYTEGLQFD
ncbi:hypothetical protein, partial [Pelagicoccus mobilis]|uniref:hypothetical protein n=1 Tax=Pelagicoccus mobilis TaxID=415221 RepID=UPI001F3143BB